MNQKSMKPKLPPVFSLAVLAALLGLGGASSHAQGSLAQGKDTLRMRLKTDIRSTDPGLNRDGTTDGVVLHVVEGLVAYREDFTIAPMLAKSVAVSPDQLSYTFTLREDVKFHNGEVLVAKDVLFTWQRYIDPKNNWRCLPEVDGRGVSKVVEVSAPDAKTVVFRLEKPSSLFLATLARPDCGNAAIYHRASLDAEGKWIAPIGTGPFRFGEWKRGQFIDLVRNEGYAALPGGYDGLVGNKSALVPRLRFVVIPDDSAAKAALLTGNIDVIPDILNSDLPTYRARKDIAVHTAPQMDIVAFLFQTRDPLLSDPRIRRAIALSFDVPKLVEAVTDGASKPSRSIIPVSSSYYGTKQAEIPARNIAAAKALLAEAGYKGQPIKWLTSKRGEMQSNTIFAQGMAQEAGLNIEIEAMDWATLLDRYTKGNYQAMSFAYSARFDPALSFEMVSGDKATQPRKVWDNAEARGLLDKAMQLVDGTERQAVLDQLEALFRADTPMIVLYSSAEISAARPGILNYKGWALGQPRGWGVSLGPAR